MKKKRTAQSGFFSLHAHICFALFVALGITAYANIITVTNTNDSGPDSLRQALADASDGDTINFDPSLNGQSITLTTAELVVDNSITVSGPGSNLLTVRANNQFFRIFHVMPGHAVIIEGLTIGPNSECDFGCGILNEQSTLSLSNCAVQGNDARDRAAGIANAGTLTISDSSIIGNHVLYTGDGPGILSSGTLTINNSIISGNAALKGYTNGGGVYSTGMLEVNNSTISNNSISTQGGGIYTSGAATITGTTISRNFAGGGYPFPNGPGFGGGIANTGTLTVINSTISGNSVLTTDSGSGCGGGIDTGGPLHLANSTISGNSATNGSSICNGAALDIGDTIVNRGTSGANIFNAGGTITSQGYNLSSDDAAGYFTGPGDQINTDPLLGPLQDNGGPTRTASPVPGQPRNRCRRSKLYSATFL